MSREYININDHFRFTSDKYNFILEEKVPEHIIKKGKYKGDLCEEKWKEISYFGNLHQLVSFCYENDIRDLKGNLTQINQSLESNRELIKTQLSKFTLSNGKIILGD